MCILFPKIMMGMISWWCCVFFNFIFLIKSLNLCNVPYEVSIMLTNFFFFFLLLLVCTFHLKCIWFVFTVLLRVALQAFSWDTTSLVACFWKRLGYKYN